LKGREGKGKKAPLQTQDRQIAKLENRRILTDSL